MKQYSNQNNGKFSGNRSQIDKKTSYGRPSNYNRENQGSRNDQGNRNVVNYRGHNSRFERPDRNLSYRDRQRSQGPTERHEHVSPRGPRSSWVEVEGRSSTEAIEEALRRYNVTRADLNIETIDEGNKGFLGIGSKPAKVKVALKSSAIMPFADGVLSRILRAMGLPDKVKSQKDSDGNPVLNILGPSSGTLIGRHGHTLESLQYLVSKIVQRMTGDDHVMIIVDVENYLERQKDKLKELAQGLAEKAKETGSEISLRPMSSKDRRVVHLTLKDNEHVMTESRGEGLRRRVIIIPKVKAPLSSNPTSLNVVSNSSEKEELEIVSSDEPLPYSPESIASSAVSKETHLNNGQETSEFEEDSFGNR